MDYICVLNGLVLTNPNAEHRFVGNHLTGWSNSDVSLVRVTNSEVPFIIRSIFGTFVNVNRMQIWSTTLNRIQNLDFDHGSRLTILEISDSDIRTLESSSFRGLQNLEQLSIVSGSIAGIQENAFEGLRRLARLDLSKNKIHDLLSNTLLPLTSVREILFSHNNMTSIPSNLFMNNTLLHTIALDNNQIIEIPRSFIDDLPNLTNLNVRSNRCTNASFGQGQLFSFDRENMDYELQHCYGNVGSGNKIEPEFVNLPCSYILINSNYTCNLQNLVVSNEQTIFRVTGTHFTGWGHSDVTSLRIASSDITFIIPRLFQVFSNLRHFDLTNTRLMQIRSSDFINARGLTSLRINGASHLFRILQGSSFNQLVNLQVLDLTSNYFVTIHENAFDGLASLRELNLAINYIGTLHANTLQPLTNLRNFIISQNSLEAIERRMFENNSNLEHVAFQDNKIMKIERGFIDELVNLRSLNMQGNLCSSTNFGDNRMFPFNRENIDYELQHCYGNVDSNQTCNLVTVSDLSLFSL